MIEFIPKARIGWNSGKDPFPGVIAVDTSKWLPRMNHDLSWEEYCKKYEVKERSTYFFDMSAEDCCKMVNITDELLESFGEKYARTILHSWYDENGNIIKCDIVDEEIILRKAFWGYKKILLAEQIEEIDLDRTELEKLFKELVNNFDKKFVKEVEAKSVEVSAEPIGRRYEVYVLEFDWDYGHEKEEVESIKAGKARRQQWEETFVSFTFTNWKLSKEVRYREELKF